MPVNPFSSGPKGYKSKNVPQYEEGAYQGIANRAGATKKEDGTYDFSNSFKPITGAEGIRKATSGYDFSPTDEAMSGYRNPTKFRFQGLPKEYGARAYESRAKDIRREGAGRLEQLRESVGVRRPDMLAKLGEDSQRQTREDLGAIGSDIALNEMDRNTDLAVDEQKSNADERFRSLGGLSDTGFKKIGTQMGAVESERAYEDQALQYLQQMFGQAAGINNQSAQIAAQNRAATLGFLSSLVGGAKSAASGGLA